MPYSITCFTKILTLAMSPFLFALVGVLSEFAMVPGVYLLLSPQEEEEECIFFLRAQMYTFSSTFIKKIETFFYYYIIMARLLVNWKKQTRNSTLFMVQLSDQVAL